MAPPASPADDFALRRLPRHCRAPASPRCMAPAATRNPVARATSDVEYQLHLPFDPFEQSAAGIAPFNLDVVKLRLTLR